MPPTKEATVIPNSAHPWRSEAPVQLSIRPQIGAVMPPRRDRPEGHRDREGDDADGKGDDAVDDALPERCIAEHRFDAGPPSVDVGERHERVGDVGAEQRLGAGALDCRHHPDELEGREQHDQSDERERISPTPRETPVTMIVNQAIPRGRSMQEVEGLLPGASLRRGDGRGGT